jgi:transcription initiation factor TFIIH subunit 3
VELITRHFGYYRSINSLYLSLTIDIGKARVYLYDTGIMAKDLTQDTIPEYPPSIPPSILLLILDLHPLSWSLLAQLPPTDEGDKIKNASINLSEFLNSLMVFLNAVLASSGGNQVVVYGATSGRSYVNQRAIATYPRQAEYIKADWPGKCYTLRQTGRKMKLDLLRDYVRIATNRSECLIHG